MAKLFLFLTMIFLVAIGLFQPNGYFAFFAAIVVYLCLGVIVEQRSSVHMMFFLGFSTFIFLPAIMNWYFLGVDFSLFFLSSISATVFLYMTKRTIVIPFAGRSSVMTIYVCCCLLSLVLMGSGQGELMAGVFAFTLTLMSLSFDQDRIKKNLLIFFLFFMVFCTYALLAWSGYGRTVILGWLLLACLQFAYSISININKYVFSLLPGLAAAMLSSRNLLDLEFKGFEAALSDSAYGPYRLASSFIEHFEMRGYDFAGFFDQIIFTFLVFVPRDVWPSKPYGFGFEYTVQHLDVNLVDAGHSIASTLIGDHIYYLGYFGVLTSCIIMAIISMAVNFLYRIKGLNGNGVLLFSASMMVLVWGGMTSFSARIALPSIIFVILLLTLRWFLTRRVRFVWGS